MIRTGARRHAARQSIPGFLLVLLANASGLVEVHVVQRLGAVRLLQRHCTGEGAFEKVTVVKVVGGEVEVDARRFGIHVVAVVSDKRLYAGNTLLLLIEVMNLLFNRGDD